MQDAVQGRLDFERINSIMNGLIEDNQAPGWLEENPHSIAGHILNLKDHKGKPLSRARLIQVTLCHDLSLYLCTVLMCVGHAEQLMRWGVRQR